MKWISVFVVSTLLFINTAFSVYKPNVIYGEDNRVDLYEIQNQAVLNAAKSTAAVISTRRLKSQGAFFEVLVGNFKTERKMCDTEPFADQPVAAFCSAFLVGKDLVATAGHCLKVTDCATTAFVFDYALMSSNDPEQARRLAVDNVYYCSRIIKREYTGSVDYALIQLDREVKSRDPLKLSTTYPTVGTEVTVIGNPAGLPTKVADGAQVRRTQTGYFVTNLDTYGGNSGSAVFNSETLEVMGILVRGERDFVYDSQLSCNVSNYCSMQGCRGEDVTHISYVQDALVQNVPHAVTYLE